ncbi:hypothetical protein D3C85_1452830 [compost metagenome]
MVIAKAIEVRDISPSSDGKGRRTARASVAKVGNDHAVLVAIPTGREVAYCEFVCCSATIVGAVTDICPSAAAVS